MRLDVAMRLRESHSAEPRPRSTASGLGLARACLWLLAQTGRAAYLGSMVSYDLERFVRAQDPVYGRVLAELRAGRKRSHFIWFVFPQLLGLGSSTMAQTYALRSLEEAVAYLRHPVLGPRLTESTHAVLSVRDTPLTAILGSVDAMKFRSSMTLFWRASGGEDPFHTALERFYSGSPDPLTLELLDERGETR